MPFPFLLLTTYMQLGYFNFICKFDRTILVFLCLGEIMNNKDIPTFDKGVEHEKDAEKTYFVFSSGIPGLTVKWYMQHRIHGLTWKPFKEEKPSYYSDKMQYRSPGWTTGNPGYKIKAVISHKNFQVEKELFWDSD
jgi:hypothetical protein